MDFEEDLELPSPSTEIVRCSLLKVNDQSKIIKVSILNKQRFVKQAKTQQLKSIIHGWGVRWNAKVDTVVVNVL